MDTINQTQADCWRKKYYNAEVIDIRRCNDDLMVMRLQPDAEMPPIQAGQYVVLGLGEWEPRLPYAHMKSYGNVQPDKLVKRAYSISCPMLNHDDEVIGVNDLGSFEFYIRLIRQPEEFRPALTPRLFALNRGSRIYCGMRIHGKYTLANVPEDADVIFCGKGTGEAPHNAMIAQLLKNDHQGRIVCVTVVRKKIDLAYLETHRQLESIYPQYRYIAMTTREPENLDDSRSDYVGKRYIQDFFESGEFEKQMAIELDPLNTHVFLCGNPDMIGQTSLLNTHPTKNAYPNGMIQILERIGFRLGAPRRPGNIHIEKYS